MLFLLIFVTTLAIWTVYLWRATQRLPKGPFPLPLIGNFHQLAYTCWKAGGTVAGFHEFKKQYGKVFTIWLGPQPTVHITDIEIAQETHVKRANVFGHRYSNGGTDYIREGRGIVASNGEFWQEHRRFALKTLRDFGLGRNLMEEKIMEEYRYRFQDFKKTNFKNGGIEVHSDSCFNLLVGSIINTLLVSERFEQNDADFEKLLETGTVALEKMSVLDSFVPLWLMKSRAWQWRTKKVFGPFEFVHGLVERKIQQRVKEIESGEHTMSETGEDFVDAFLIKMEKDKKDGVKGKGVILNFPIPQMRHSSLENLAIDLYDLWLAGQETTSTTMVWACACLLNHPEVVGELKRELVGVTGGTRALSLTDKPNTPFLNATINEVQRIASILNSNLFRQLEEDTVIDGQPVSAGALVTVQLSALHTDEAVFKNHTKFDPKSLMKNRNLEKNLIPFGIGKRSCPGESLARAELYLITGNLILDFDREPVGPAPEIKTTAPFGLMKRPPSYDIRFVPIEK